MEHLFQVTMQIYNLPPYRLIQLHQNVHIADERILASGTGAKDSDPPDVILLLEFLSMRHQLGLDFFKRFHGLNHYDCLTSLQPR